MGIKLALSSAFGMFGIQPHFPGEFDLVMRGSGYPVPNERNSRVAAQRRAAKKRNNIRKRRGK